MSKILQCPWFASDGFSKWCMNGHFPMLLRGVQLRGQEVRGDLHNDINNLYEGGLTYEM